MEMTRFEKYLREIEPYWQKYLQALKERGLNPPPGIVDCFDEAAYKLFKAQADLILMRIIAEEKGGEA